MCININVLLDKFWIKLSFNNIDKQKQQNNKMKIQPHQ